VAATAPVVVRGQLRSSREKDGAEAMGAEVERTTKDGRSRKKVREDGG
jgi:hypothetical protein